MTKIGGIFVVKKFLILFVTIGLACVLFGVIYNVTSNSVKKPSGTIDESKTYEIGAVVNFAGTQLTVVDVEKSQGVKFDHPSIGNEFVILTVELVNNSDDSLDYYPNDFKLQNSQGQLFDIDSTSINVDTALHAGKLNSGSKIKRTLAFEIPRDDLALKLIYAPITFSNGDSIKVYLH